MWWQSIAQEANAARIEATAPAVQLSPRRGNADGFPPSWESIREPIAAPTVGINTQRGNVPHPNVGMCCCAPWECVADFIALPVTPNMGMCCITQRGNQYDQQQKNHFVPFTQRGNVF